MRLQALSPVAGSRKIRKRLGRGVGSGSGKTSGRGTKGHKSRSGGGVRPGFEGGQMPLHRRLPKRGFANIFRKDIVIVNIRDLAKFEKGSIVDETALIQSGLIRGKRDGIKLLGQGEIEHALTIKVNSASKSAIEKVTRAGGKIEVIAS